MSGTDTTSSTTSGEQTSTITGTATATGAYTTSSTTSGTTQSTSTVSSSYQLQLSAAGDSSVIDGNSWSLSLDVQDGGGVPVNVTIDWGDGYTSEWGVSNALSDVSTVMAHQFADPVFGPGGEGPPAPPPPEFLVDVKAVDANGANREVELAVRLVPKVTIAATDAKAAERTGGDGHFQVTRTGSLDNPLTVSYTIGGTAINGTDYTQIGSSVTIAAGVASATVTIHVLSDGSNDGVETSILTLAPQAGVYVVGTPASATVSMLDIESQVFKVSFLDDNRIYRDPTPTTYNAWFPPYYTAPQWVIGPVGKVAPVSYTSGADPNGNDVLHAGAQMNVPTGWTDYYPSTMAKAAGTSGYDLTPGAATMSNGYLTVQDEAAVKPFDNYANYYSAFTLSWKISVDGGTTWVDVGQSTNPLYVTWKSPATTLYETVLQVGTVGATGKVTEADIVNGVFSQFATLSVIPRGGTKALVYDHTPEAALGTDASPDTAAELLAFGHGNCDSWSEFFNLTLESQGVSTAAERLIVPINGFAFGGYYIPYTVQFMVGGIVFNAPGGPYKGVPTGYDWNYPDDTGKTTPLPSQGHGSPVNIFYHHAIVVYSGTIFDPSYGKWFNSLSAWEEASVSALAVSVKGNYYLDKRNPGDSLMELQ